MTIEIGEHLHDYIDPVGADGIPTFNDPICRICGQHPDLDDLPWAPPEPDDRAAISHPRPCRRHQWSLSPIEGWRCLRCNRIRDEARSRRGRNARKRGNAIELQMARALGLQKVGQYGTEVDARTEAFIAQVKSGVAFPERLWKWLNAMSGTASQTRLLVVTDAPGPGRRRRALVITTLEEWAALHGAVEP